MWSRKSLSILEGKNFTAFDRRFANIFSVMIHSCCPREAGANSSSISVKSNNDERLVINPCIITIVSHPHVRPTGASIPDAVSKAGLIHMTKLLAVTLASAIRINASAPGLVDTPMTAGWKAAKKRWRARRCTAPRCRRISPILSRCSSHQNISPAKSSSRMAA